MIATCALARAEDAAPSLGSKPAEKQAAVSLGDSSLTIDSGLGKQINDAIAAFRRGIGEPGTLEPNTLAAFDRLPENLRSIIFNAQFPSQDDIRVDSSNGIAVINPSGTSAGYATSRMRSEMNYIFRGPRGVDIGASALYQVPSLWNSSSLRNQVIVLAVPAGLALLAANDSIAFNERGSFIRPTAGKGIELDWRAGASHLGFSGTPYSGAGLGGSYHFNSGTRVRIHGDISKIDKTGTPRFEGGAATHFKVAGQNAYVNVSYFHETSSLMFERLDVKRDGISTLAYLGLNSLTGEVSWVPKTTGGTEWEAALNGARQLKISEGTHISIAAGIRRAPAVSPELAAIQMYILPGAGAMLPIGGINPLTIKPPAPSVDAADYTVRANGQVSVRRDTSAHSSFSLGLSGYVATQCLAGGSVFASIADLARNINAAVQVGADSMLPSPQVRVTVSGRFDSTIKTLRSKATVLLAELYEEIVLGNQDEAALSDLEVASAAGHDAATKNESKINEIKKRLGEKRERMFVLASELRALSKDLTRLEGKSFNAFGQSVIRDLRRHLRGRMEFSW